MYVYVQYMYVYVYVLYMYMYMYTKYITGVENTVNAEVYFLWNGDERFYIINLADYLPLGSQQQQEKLIVMTFIFVGSVSLKSHVVVYSIHLQ